MTTDTKLHQNIAAANNLGKAGVASGTTTLPNTRASSEALRGKASLTTVGFLLVTMIIGYEWFMSGLVKIARGDFPAGLAAELLAKAEGVPAWYASLMTSAFIPNAQSFGYVIEIAEILAGVALIVGPLIWLFAWDRVSDRTRKAVLFSMAVATIGATYLAINLHLANGAPHPWLIPGNSFDEGIDLDSILPATQIVIAVVSIIFLNRLRRERTHEVAVA